MKPEPVFLAFISVWEAAALITGRVPTITSQVNRLSLRSRRLLVAAASWWLVNHFETRNPKQLGGPPWPTQAKKSRS